MNKNDVFRRLISLFIPLILIFLTQGCFSLREISKSDNQNINRRFYIIHGPSSSYIIKNVTFSNGMLTGSLVSATKSSKLKTIHIYAAPDSSIKINENIVSVPFANIVKREADRLNGIRTGAVIGALSLAVVLIIIISIPGGIGGGL